MLDKQDSFVLRTDESEYLLKKVVFVFKVQRMLLMLENSYRETWVPR